MGSASKVASNFLWRFFERFGAQMLNIVVGIILARKLGPGPSGQIAVVLAVINILKVFADSGMANALIQKKDPDDLDFSSVFFFNLAFSLVLYLGLFLAAPAIARFYREDSYVAILRVLGLLVVTLIAGEVSNGLKGWMKSNILGRSIQPSEFAKLSILLMLARYLSRFEKPMTRFKEVMNVGLIVGIPSLVVLAQGETGTVIVIVFMFLVMIYFAGVDIRLITAILAVGVVGIGIIVGYALMSETTDYRILRLLAFMDPQKYEQSGGYQIIKSQTAIGAGQLTGVGTFLEGSWTTLGYVPESSTDSIFTVVGESFGFVGCMAVLAAYFFIVIRMIYLARFTQDKFGRLVIIGVMAMLFFHVFQNIAMSMGIMPITGIPLPFLSYGGSNFITNIAAVALVLNITRGRSAATLNTVQAPGLG
ncbi:MAG: FtsW/RodA/SpoVE family cell cycle protein [Clostridia bacterium]|nr:FtsW/RodA/SpoVE family cell cycle protein [Clostridia bacterium]